MNLHSLPPPPPPLLSPALPSPSPIFTFYLSHALSFPHSLPCPPSFLRSLLPSTLPYFFLFLPPLLLSPQPAAIVAFYPPVTPGTNQFAFIAQKTYEKRAMVAMQLVMYGQRDSGTIATFRNPERRVGVPARPIVCPTASQSACLPACLPAYLSSSDFAAVLSCSYDLL